MSEEAFAKAWTKGADESLNKEETAAFLSVYGGEIGFPALSAEDVDALFTEFDADGNGLIDANEMKTLIAKAFGQ